MPNVNEPLDIEAIVNKLDSQPAVAADPEDAAAAQIAAQIEGQQPNTAAAETPPSGQPEGEGSGEAALPPIEPPVSWTTANKEAFAQLPRHLQEVVAERERERESHFGRQSNELAEQRRTIEQAKAAADAERARIAEERQKALSNFDTVLSAVIASDPIIAEGKAINWPQLASTDPATYAAKKAIFDDRVQKLSQVVQQRETLAQQALQEQQKAVGERVAKEFSLLLEKVPEWRESPEKAAAARNELASHARTKYGISEQELAQVSDHRALLMLRDNALMSKRVQELETELAKAKASKDATLKEIESKKANAPAPKVAAPRAASEGKSPSEKTKALLNQARRSGKDSDRVDAVLAAIQGAG